MSEKVLAAEVIKLAVEDLEKVAQKLKKWEALQKERELFAYVMERVCRPLPDYASVSITMDDATAIDMFNLSGGGNDKYHLMFSLVGIDSIPKHIRETAEYAEGAVERLNKVIKPMVEEAIVNRKETVL